MDSGIFTNNALADLSFFFFLNIHSFMRDAEREAETQAEGEAGLMQGA